MNALNKYPLHRLMKSESEYFIVTKSMGVILSNQEFTAIHDIQRTTFLFILALNWLVARFVKLNDDKEIKYSQSALFKQIKERVETMCGRLTEYFCRSKQRDDAEEEGKSADVDRKEWRVC